MKVSTSGFYAWRAQPCPDRDWDDAILTNTIIDIHTMSRGSYGAPRVHAELRLGLDTRCSRKRVERLMRQAGVAGSVARAFGDRVRSARLKLHEPDGRTGSARAAPTSCGARGPEEEIANELGIGLRTLQRRRQRAERRLALAS